MTTANPAVTTDAARTLDLPRPARPAGALTTALGVARRTVLRNVRNPQVFVLGMVQGAMFLLIFRYVFGGAITTNGVRYVDFLVPGFVGTGVLFAGMGSAIGVAEDLQEGFFDRLRSLPVPRTAVVGGRVLADTVLAGIGLTVTILVGFLVGFRTSAPIGGLLLAVALCLFAAFAFTWMFVLMGIVSGNPQAAQGMGLLVFPFTFVSSAFVPVESMPAGLEQVADANPVSVVVDAMRALWLGAPAGDSVWLSVVWCVVLIAVFAPLAVARYRKAASH